MDWLNRMNEAIRYIEDNLAGSINYETASQKACCSVYHFQRMFSYMAGVPISEYIRCRRLALAAFDLRNSNEKVIDIGLKYGYESPTAFTRAFGNMHGISPTAAKENGATVKAYPPISFQITVKGAVEMKYRIEERLAFHIVGVSEQYSLNIEENFKKVPLFWQKTTMDGSIPKILSLMNQPPLGILGVSTWTDGNVFDYFIAVSSNKAVPQGMKEYTVPACTWAIFECIGPMPQAMQSLQKRIVTEWLPSSGYEYANAPDIEVYSDGDQSSNDYRCEVWLPIIKK